MSRRRRLGSGIGASLVIIVVIAMGACSSPSRSDSAALRVGSLRGPTTMGIAPLVSSGGGGLATFTVAATPDQLTGPLATGDLDAALLPLNLAATLDNKTNGSLRMVAVTSLGALYAVVVGPGTAPTGGGAPAAQATTLRELLGGDVVSTGLGSMPQAVVQYLLRDEGANPDAISFQADPAQVAATITAHPGTIGILPEPQVTSLLALQPRAAILADIGQLWSDATGEPLVIAVLVVRSDVAERSPDRVKALVAAIVASVNQVNADPAAAGGIIAGLGIVPNANIAAAAVPRSRLVALTGVDARDAALATLSALAQSDSSLIGGAVPPDAFFPAGAP